MMVSGSNADLRHTLQGHAVQALSSAPSSPVPAWPEVDAAGLELLVEALESSRRRGQQQFNAMAARGLLDAHFSLSDYTLRSRRQRFSSSSAALSSSSSSVSPDMQTHLALLWRTLSILRFAGLPRALQAFFSQLLTAVVRMPPLSLSSHFATAASSSASASTSTSALTPTDSAASEGASTSLVRGGGGAAIGLLPVPELQYLSATYLAVGATEGQHEAPLGHDPSLIGAPQSSRPSHTCFFSQSHD